MNISEVKPEMAVNLIESLGPRSNMRRRSAWCGFSRRVPARVVSVGEKLVTVEAGGRLQRVEARQLVGARDLEVAVEAQSEAA